MITDEELLKYGIKSIMTIAESTFKPRLIITHLDEKQYYYDIDDVGDVYSETIERIFNEHINIVCIKKIRKYKLNEIF